MKLNLTTGERSFSRLISTIFGLVVAYIWFFIFTDLYSLILREITTASIFIILTYIYVKPNIKMSFNKVSLKELRQFAASMWALNFLENIIKRLDFAIFGLLAGKEALGIYFTIRNVVDGLLGFVLNPVQTVLLSYYARLKKSVGYFKYLIIKISIVYLPISIAIVIVVWLLKKQAINILLGSQYYTGEAFLVGLSIYFLMIWFENIKVFAMAERIHHIMIFPRVLQVIIYFIIIYPMFNNFGYSGASIATGVAAIVLSISSTIIGEKIFF